MKLLLNKLYQRGIRLEVMDDELKIKAPKGALDQEILQEIKNAKTNLIELLSKSNSSIPKTSIKEFYPLSAAQKRMWILSQLDGGKSAYNIFGAFEMIGPLDIKILEQSFLYIIERQDILRSAFIEKDGEVFQYISNISSINFNLEITEIEDNEDEMVNQFFDTEFDLSNAPLFKAKILKSSAQRSILLFAMHHIIGDAWSLNIFTNELLKCYNAILYNKEIDLPHLRIQYQDFAAWQNGQKSQKGFKISEKYWLKKFDGEIPVLDLPRFKQRPQVQTFNGASVRHKFSPALSSRIKEFSKNNKVTLFMTLMAGVNALLHRYTGQNDIIIGTPIAGRENLDLENQIGLFLNTLALRSEIKGNDVFTDFLNRQKQTLLEAYEHQNYPFDQLISELNLKHDTSRNPLFDVMVVLQNQSQAKSTLTIDDNLEAIQTKQYELDFHSAHFDISFVFIESEVLTLKIEYNTDIYDEILIEQLFTHYENLMSQVIDNPNISISSIDYISEKEKHQLIEEFNDTAVDYPTGKTVIDLFEERVLAKPMNIAVVSEGKKLTYKQLNEKANQLAEYLQSDFNVQPNDFVALKLDRSENLLIAILGTLKSGAAYVPIDTDYPQQRIEYIEKDSNTKVIIDQSFFDLFENSRDNLSKENNSKAITPENTAYVIYTSGTTGVPKGVMISHRSLINLCNWHKNEYDVSEKSKATLFAGIAFDASIWEITPYLLNGATLYPLNDENTRFDTNKLSDFLNKNEISHSYIPTAICHDLVREGIELKHTKVLVGGDTLKLKEAPGFQLYNNYGPTESTVVTTSYLVNYKESLYASIPIGSPISNTRVYILDDNLELLPIGVSGKLYISGVGLAKGYLNRPELTKEKFIDNPFENGQKMYDTGDMAKWLPDGNIAFLGRRDQQVKIRGYRIELGEIENSILSYSKDISQAVVIVDNEKLIAYFSHKNNIDKNALKEHLRASLPSFMVPSHLEILESIPLTPNGKVDRNKLKNIDIKLQSTTNYIAPRNTTEQKLVEIWQEILGIESIGVQDNFFDLGGHSLMIVQVVNQIYKKLNGRISYKEFFQYPSIAYIAKAIKSESYTSIPKAQKQEYYPLAPSQLRIWILSQLDGGSTAYNMPGTVILKGILDIDKFNRAIELLIDRHEILRTAFRNNEEGEIRQYIVDSSALNFDIEYFDFKGQSTDTIDNYLHEEQQAPFDLTTAPLLKASLLRTKDDVHIFSFVIHHIIGDGWSMELMISEVIDTYNQLLKNDKFENEDLVLQYKDYSVWLHSQLQGEANKTSEAYWLDKFQGELPVLELPSFKKRPAIQTYIGKTIKHQFSKPFLTKLKQFSKEQDVTLFMTLMTGINALFYRYTHQNDIIIGTPIAGREHPDLENQIGLYLNTLAIRTQIESGLSLEDLLQQQKQTLLEAYEHQSYPFSELVNKLSLSRDTSRSILFDVMVILQNQSQLHNINKDQDFEGVQVEQYDMENISSKFDINFTFVEGEGLGLSIEYNTDIYDAFIIERMIAHYKNLMDQVVDNPKQSISSVAYITEREKQQIREEFNNTQIDHPRNETIISLFEKQVKETPENIALVYKEEELTFAELNQKSNQLARHLQRNFDIQSNDLVALKMDRSENLLIAIFGILKSGAAYVPIDTEYPQQRIEHIEKDSNAKVVIDQSFFEAFEIERDTYDSENVNSPASIDNLAYIIYTSGTTGKPKGVAISHGNAVELLNWAKQEFKSDSFDIAYATTSHCFDLSIYEMFFPLTTGKKIRLLNDALEIGLHIQKDTKVLINTVPSSIRSLLDNGTNLENASAINLAGEPFPIDIGNKLVQSNAEVRNLYGPSEDTTYSTSYKLDRNRKYTTSIPIGRPISNTRIYILDDNLELLPVGISGKLYISGNGLAKGYLNRPELTKEKFIDNPFVEGQRMYDTGDMAKWLPDGNIAFLGRKDHQVKLRGYRIELGEIESSILAYSEDISQAVVLVKNETLIAYYSEKNSTDKNAIKEHLRAELPSYMIPNHFEVLESIPLTPNGKIDIKKLKNLSVELKSSSSFLAPRNEMEHKLTEIWQEILGIEKVGIQDDFFELGGHSLKAHMLTNMYRKQFGVALSMKDIFSNNTITDQVKLIEQGNSDDYEKVEKAPKMASYPISRAQRRIYLADILEKDAASYNVASLNKVILDYPIEYFTEAVHKIIAKYDILRTIFKNNEEGEVRQHIIETADLDYNIEIHDYSEHSNKHELIELYNEETSSQSFDLDRGPLFIVTIFKTGASEYYVYFNIHHIICDEFSLEILRSEVITTAEALNNNSYQETSLNIQYKDFSYWESKGKFIDEEKNQNYWHNRMSQPLIKTNLPERESRLSFKNNQSGHAIQYCFSEKHTKQIYDLAKKNKVTPFALVLTISKSMLYIYSGHKDILSGTPVNGRLHPDLAQHIGFFSNLMVMRNTIRPEKSFIDNLISVSDDVLEDFKYQNFPFDQLLEELKIERSPFSSPLFDVFISMGNDVKVNATDFLDIGKIEDKGRTIIKFDLNLFFKKINNHLSFKIGFNIEMYQLEMIQNFLENMVKFTIQVLQKPNTPLMHIDLSQTNGGGFIKYNQLDKNQKKILRKILPNRKTQNLQIEVFNEDRIAVPSGAAGLLGFSTELLPDARKFSYEILGKNKRENIEEFLIKTNIKAIKRSQGLYILGDKNRQIHINGDTIHLNKVTDVLESFKEIQSALVVKHPLEDKSIIAYLKVHNLFKIKQFFNFLKNKLPKNSIPDYYKIVERFPPLKNGTVKEGSLRRILPVKLVTEGATGIDTELLESVTNVFKEVLEVDQINPEDNLLELGLSSLNLSVVLGRIHQDYDVFIEDISEIFINPHIIFFVNRIEQETRQNK